MSNVGSNSECHKSGMQHSVLSPTEVRRSQAAKTVGARLPCDSVRSSTEIIRYSMEIRQYTTRNRREFHQNRKISKLLINRYILITLLDFS